MKNPIRELKELIILSLDGSPASVDELMKRDFLHNRAKNGIELLLRQLEIGNCIYWKGKKLYARKASVKDVLKRY